MPWAMLVLHFQDLPTLIFLRSKWNERKKKDLICIVLMLMTTAGDFQGREGRCGFTFCVLSLFFFYFYLGEFLCSRVACLWQVGHLSLKVYFKSSG